MARRASEANCRHHITNTTAAGVQIFLGDKATAMPAPCTGTETYNETTHTGCGHHLTNGTFTISASSPSNAALGGKIVNGTFNGGPGDITLQIALGTTQPLTLSLLNARAKAMAITDAGMTLTVGGALTTNDLNMQVLPAIQAQVAMLLDRDCGSAANRMLPTCGCASTSTSASLLNLFDGDIAGTVKDSYTKRGYAAAMHTQLDTGILDYCRIAERRLELLYGSIEGEPYPADILTAARNLGSAF